MSCKQLATQTASAVLLILLLNISFATAASSESEPAVSEDEGRSYFGYQPKPKDSYKKLVEDLSEFAVTSWGDWLSLYAKIEALHKKLYYRKDKDYGGYDYSKLHRMQQLLSEQKATIDALRSDRLNVPTV
uniref:Uncharacterized protein n=1 Tax=Anopheles atroparvus TaxID=41427 RepID=A0AAG5D7L4_ANOAO